MGNALRKCKALLKDAESLTNTLELKDFYFSLWAGRGQNTVCLWQL